MAAPAGASNNPSRSARSRTWAADSSPVAYTMGRPDAGRRLEEQRRLADARLATEQDQRARDDRLRPGPGRARRSTSGDAGPRPRRCHAARPAARRSDATRAGGRRRRLRTHDRLDQAVPFPAGTALSFPAKEGFAAALTDEPARGLGHGKVSAPRPASGTRRRGCPGRPPGPCRRRSSCPVRSGPGADAPRGRPRSCSG